MIQAGVIIAGISTIVNCIEVKRSGFPLQVGTGLTSILVNSSVFVPTFVNSMERLVVEDGESVHDAFGRVLGTAAVCSLAYIALALIPRKYVKVLFPPLVSGMILVLIGAEMMIRAAQMWGGGVLCAEYSAQGVPCGDTGNVHLPFGSAEYLGLGLFVLSLYFICDLFGSPFIRHNIISISVLVVYAISAFFKKDGKYYVNGDEVDEAPPIAFLWTTTYELGIHKGSILPLLGAFIVTYLETTVILTGTLEESKIDLTETEADDKIQGGLLISAVSSFFAVLATGLPLAPCAYNNTIVKITNQAPSTIGIATGVWLLVFGILGKLLGLYLDIPGPLRGAMGIYLISGVIWTGFKILTRVRWDRRMMTIVFFSFSFGLAGIVEHAFINDELWHEDPDKSEFVISLRLAIIEMMRVPYFLGGVIAIVLNLTLPKRMEIGDDDEVLPEALEE